MTYVKGGVYWSYNTVMGLEMNNNIKHLSNGDFIVLPEQPYEGVLAKNLNNERKVLELVNLINELIKLGFVKQCDIEYLAEVTCSKDVSGMLI